jgi:hypothetical protein
MLLDNDNYKIYRNQQSVLGFSFILFYLLNALVKQLLLTVILFLAESGDHVFK